MKRDIIVFTIGAAVGSVATYFLTKKHLEKGAEELMDQIADDAAEMRRRRMTQDPDPEADVQQVRKLIRRYDQKGNATLEEVEPARTKPWIIEEVTPSENHPVDSNEDEGPYVISLDEFHEGMPHYDKLTLFFYEDDEVLTDDQEEIIDDEEQIVGSEALTCFGHLSHDPEVVYVRNSNASTDFEVIRLSKSYAETVGLSSQGGDEDGEE